MVASFKTCLRNVVLACAAAFALLALPSWPARADTPGNGEAVTIRLDEARLIRVPDRVTTLIVGNPLVADVSLQTGGILVLTGKGYGQTNLIALDRGGNKLLEKNLIVKGAPETVTVHRGILRETYSCTPRCEPRNTLGDGPEFFNTTLGQGVTRSNQAAAAK